MSTKKKEFRDIYIEFIKTHYQWILLGVLFIVYIFLRFYMLEARLPFGFDQTDNAWAAKRIIIDHDTPLLGMQAKNNTGFNIGPAYYYYIALFYWIFNLNPIAAGYAAGVAAIITFFTLFFITKKLFSFPIAFLVVSVDTISSFVVRGDRTAWPVNFIVPISLVIFFVLNKIIQGNIKYIPILAIIIGLSFHIHFTSVLYILIVLLTVPFFPKRKETIYTCLLSIPLFLVWLLPIVYFSIISKSSQITNMSSYIHTTYLGLHITRVFQVMHDAFIQFLLTLQFSFVDYFDFLLPLIFVGLYYYRDRTTDRFKFCYILLLWFLVPWIVFATYKGEISDYYFSMTRPIAYFILAYLSYRLFIVKNIIPKIIVVLFFTYFISVNLIGSLRYNQDDFSDAKKRVIPTIKHNAAPHFDIHTPDSYLYYYYHDYKKEEIE